MGKRYIGIGREKKNTGNGTQINVRYDIIE